MLALSFFVGILTALQFSFLPSAYWLLLLPVFVVLSIFTVKPRVFTVFILGLLWVFAHGHYVLSNALPDELQGKDLIVVGSISGLPDATEKRTRFVFDVDKLSFDGVSQTEFPAKIRISWYGGLASEVKAGERWQLMVRLKQPHGMLNPGSFDYEKWLFERKIRATGYVKKSDDNIRLSEASFFSVNAYREKLKNDIIKLMPDSDYRSIVLALALGDKSEITPAQWDVFTATGTNHLVAISGLHIGLVAGAVFFLAGMLARRLPGLLIHFPYYKVAAFAAMIAALFYAMLAGFAIPTQRALIMIAVVMLFMMRSQRINARTILLSALVMVLIVDPFSALSVGFWLSFIAVAAILYAMQSRTSAKGLWWKWGRLQWIVSVALIPALLFTFQTFSIISPIANVLAVPWVSFFVVPLVLLSVVFSFLSPVAEFFLFLADQLLFVLWLILDYLAALPYAQWQQFSPLGWTLVPAVLGVILMLAPKGFPAKYLAIFLLLPMFIVKPPTPDANQFKFSLLDVGQGLAAVVQTQNHLLVFDTGPRYLSGFDTGEAVVMPYLRSIGVSKIDTLMISHGDNDHIGGAASLIKNMDIERILTSVPEKITNKSADLCFSGLRWVWDGVVFEVLNPESLDDFGRSRKSGNNRSCVLRVSAGENAVLLTGDIEKRAEKKLLKKWLKSNPEKLMANLLTAPHHGSNSSSTSAFIKAVDPGYVLYATGFRNRYGFPKPRVMARYEQLGVKAFNSTHTGTIMIDVKPRVFGKPRFYREDIRRFWHHS